MKTLHRKLLRNLWSMKGQAAAISLVIASGVATLIVSLSTMDSLKATQSVFYRDYRFAQIFASLKRAPDSVRYRLHDVEGVDKIESRVVAPIHIDIPHFPDPVKGQIISIPDSGDPLLNILYLRAGKLPEPFSDNEVVVGESFAEAHGLKPGDVLEVVINGNMKTFSISGIVLSPEHIYQMPPGAFFPDFERFGLLWMRRTPLASAFDMEGSFNDIILTLSPGARTEDVIDRIDEILKSYGGLGAFSRKDQLSHRYLSEEFRQLENMSTIFPVIFLGVAAFLLHVVINRLVRIQKEEIAVLKAFGYANRDIGIHFLTFISLIVFVGVVTGTVGGAWLARWMANIYMEFYRFPFLTYILEPKVVVYATVVSMAAAVLGTIHAIHWAVQLPPAEAMQPEPPARYRESLPERLGMKALLSQPSRMIIRHVARRPFKSLLTVTGIALACAIMMVGNFQEDALDFMVDVQFGLAQREDLTVTFVEPTSRKALQELRSIRGVEHVEPFRAVPVRLTYRHRSYRTVIQGLHSGGDLQRLLNIDLQPVAIPPSGILLNDHLAKMLGAREGDILTVEVLEENRPVYHAPVTALVRQYMGVSAYMDLHVLNRLMHEGDAISGAFIAADSFFLNELFAKLKKIPRIAGTEMREKAIDSFYETMGGTILIFTFINTLLAGIIAFGVVYNSARIALSERSRELASLRVLGFSRGEISYILLGELGMLTLMAIPAGFIIGRGLCAYMVKRFETDLFRVPLIVEPSTYAFASVVVLISALVSALIVRKRLDNLDLIAVLKTRE